MKEATDYARRADVAVLLMQTGLAHLVLVAGSLSVTKARIDMPVPRKKAGATAIEKVGMNTTARMMYSLQPSSMMLFWQLYYVTLISLLSRSLSSDHLDL